MKKSSTIRFRLIALSMMVLFSMSALGFAGYYTFGLVQERARVTDLLEQETTILLSILRNITEIVLIPDNPQTVKNVRSELDRFSWNLERLSLEADDEELSKAISSKITPEWNAVRTGVLEFLKIARPSPDDVDTMIKFGKLNAATDKLLKQMTSFKADAGGRSETYMYSITIAMGLIASGLILMTAIVLTSISRSISKPLDEIAAGTERIAQGNLTIELTVSREDEIGALAKSFREMVNKLRTMIRQTSTVSADVNLTAENMAASARNVLASVNAQNSAIAHTVGAMEDVDCSVSRLQESSRLLIDAATATSSASTELAASISQVAGNAGSLDASALKAVADLVEMVATGDSIAASVEKLSLFAEETSQSIEKIGSKILNVQDNANQSVMLAEQVSRSSSEQGMVAINDAMAGIENIQHSVSALSEVVNRLGSKSMQIGKIINVIEDIASQTGLLALNAAILAAQAGQHGRSFAVVASEIRSLSDRTFLSTKEIVDVITSVQSESSSSVKMAQAGMNAVQQGITLIERVKDALESIYTNSLASTEMSHAIHRETTEEVLVINSINESIGTLRDQVDEISRAVQQQNSNTGDMNSLMEQIQKIAEEIAVATHEQAKTSVQISEIADSLLEQSDQINQSIAVQKQKSGAVLASSSSVRETADQLGQLAHDMERAAKALREKARSLTSSINIFEV